ncbi:MAG: hypothetical protein AAGJ82_08210 [Bacteroidota bacterium]
MEYTERPEASLSRYFANEKWLAFGLDAFTNPEEEKRFSHHLKQKGTGLLLADEAGKVIVIHPPTSSSSWQEDDFLVHYVNENVVRYYNRKNKRLFIKRTPAQKNKKAQRIIYILAILICVGILIALQRQAENTPWN